MNEPAVFYSTPGPMTDLAGTDRSLLTGLHQNADDLSRVSRRLIVHEFLAGAYGLDDISHRMVELERRRADEIVSAIAAIDPSPLVEPRPPESRLVGNCRQFAVLTCALLRRAGVPARVRAGFSGYFDDTWVDHWIVERADPDAGEWVRTDPQLDETQLEMFQIDFDPMRLPEGRFLTGSEAWHRYRNEDVDPQLFGIQDMRGPWFIAASAVRDLAALNKVEVHVWDTWGLIDELAFRDLTPEEVRLIDDVANTVLGGDHEAIVATYQREGIRIPGEVTSNRFERTITLDGLAP